MRTELQNIQVDTMPKATGMANGNITIKMGRFGALVTMLTAKRLERKRFIGRQDK